MRFVSTNGRARPVGFRDAVLAGLAGDGGLFMPDRIPTVDAGDFHDRNAAEIAETVLGGYVGDDISDLNALCERVFAFPFPIRDVAGGRRVLELFEGPTLAFKDVGARFLAECLGRFAGDRATVVLVATSGDTGSAVANGFLGVDGVQTVILYPRGKVSPLQEQQFASLGGNTTALAVDGVFDDCQRLVKAAFNDAELRAAIPLSSANSINVARWLPQSVYYYYAGTRVSLATGAPPVIAVPSGNFGNLTAGMLAERMGLPVARWIAATNANDVVPEWLRSGDYQPRPSVATLANAMDVGDPSNQARLLHLFGGDVPAIRERLSGVAFDDDAIGAAIRRVREEHGYLLDPHGATGWLALEAADEAGLFLATAHPAKFADRIEPLIGSAVDVPERLAAFAQRKVVAERMEADYGSFRDFLRDAFG